MNKVIENLNWRSAVKKYDSQRKLSAENLEILKEAIRLSPTSFGLQLFKVLVIEDPETKQKLQNAAYGQEQIGESSQLFVFANYTKVTDAQIDEYFNQMIKMRNLKIEDVASYKEDVSRFVKGLGDHLGTWTAKQTYLALGILLITAAELQIDASPMEGFNAEEFNRILDLEKHNLNTSVIAAVGYRSDNDFYSKMPKIRKSKEEIFLTI
ncbi:NAD(P)H-dependent oxidoreductase [Soonwooa sp.]|uniref:NAD(P)H-dependent oxidoreductase n=1 Tax=Soonwooa sp. TaxID=1938592 RepID=UPI00260B5006|nr:NAD(P)H-dependent oxidoreductase [Soonwooa sp.]